MSKFSKNLSSYVNSYFANLAAHLSNELDLPEKDIQKVLDTYVFGEKKVEKKKTKTTAPKAAPKKKTEKKEEKPKKKTEKKVGKPKAAAKKKPAAPKKTTKPKAKTTKKKPKPELSLKEKIFNEVSKKTTVSQSYYNTETGRTFVISKRKKDEGWIFVEHKVGKKVYYIAGREDSEKFEEAKAEIGYMEPEKEDSSDSEEESSQLEEKKATKPKKEKTPAPKKVEKPKAKKPAPKKEKPKAKKVEKKDQTKAKKEKSAPKKEKPKAKKEKPASKKEKPKAKKEKAKSEKKGKLVKKGKYFVDSIHNFVVDKNDKDLVIGIFEEGEVLELVDDEADAALVVGYKIIVEDTVEDTDDSEDIREAEKVEKYMADDKIVEECDESEHEDTVEDEEDTVEDESKGKEEEKKEEFFDEEISIDIETSESEDEGEEGGVVEKKVKPVEIKITKDQFQDYNDNQPLAPEIHEYIEIHYDELEKQFKKKSQKPVSSKKPEPKKAGGGKRGGGARKGKRLLKK